MYLTRAHDRHVCWFWPTRPYYRLPDDGTADRPVWSREHTIIANLKTVPCPHHKWHGAWPNTKNKRRGSAYILSGWCAILRCHVSRTTKLALPVL